MSVLLEIVIYASTVGIGIYATLFGSAWPTMYGDLATDISNAGIVTLCMSISFILFGTLSEKLEEKFKTHTVVAIGLALITLAQFFFAISRSFIQITVAAALSSAGAGTVDYSLNKYLAVRGEQRHMNWLHSFWAVGALIGPLIASVFIRQDNWRLIYFTSAIIQGLTFVLVILSTKLWNGVEKEPEKQSIKSDTSNSYTLSFALMAPAILMCFFTVAVENSTNYWGSSFISVYRNVSPDKSATFVSVFFACLMLGRFFAGILSSKLNNIQMIWLGIGFMSVGTVIFALPVPDNVLYAALALMGLGNGPLIPSLFHETPRRVGVENSQRAIGLQMSAAGLSSAILPTFFGWLSRYTGMGAFPILLLIYNAITIFAMILLSRPTTSD